MYIVGSAPTKVHLNNKIYTVIVDKMALVQFQQQSINDNHLERIEASYKLKINNQFERCGAATTQGRSFAENDLASGTKVVTGLTGALVGARL